MPVEPVTGSALAVKAMCMLPLKAAAVGAGSHTAAAAVVAAAPSPEVTSFGATGPPEITITQPTVTMDPTGPPMLIVDIPAPPELTIPPEVLANVENIVNAIRLPEPTAFTATPGTYREFPGPFDVRAVHQTPQVGEREARTLSDLGMQDLVDRANALNKQLFEHPTMGLPSQLYQDAYNDIVRRMDAFRGYDASPQIGAAIMENIVHPPELTPVAPSAINGMLVPVFEAIRATCGDCCRRSVPQRSSSSSSFLDVEDRSPLRRVLMDTYTAYADAWIGMSSALHEIMA